MVLRGIITNLLITFNDFPDKLLYETIDSFS